MEQEKEKNNAVMKQLTEERVTNKSIENELRIEKSSHHAIKIKFDHLQSELVVEKRNHTIHVPYLLVAMK